MVLKRSWRWSRSRAFEVVVFRPREGGGRGGEGYCWRLSIELEESLVYGPRYIGLGAQVAFEGFLRPVNIHPEESFSLVRETLTTNNFALIRGHLGCL